METKTKIKLYVYISILAFLILRFWLIPTIAPEYKAWENTVEHAVQKADDATNYKTLKKVEDTCRAMQASYQADKLTWEQYRHSETEERRSWADQALTRANRTAATYNAYILENSYVWADNVPKDISKELPYLTAD